MLIVNLDALQKALNTLREINETKLEDIVWLENSFRVLVSDEEIQEFKYTGLNNVDFARSYKGWIK